MNKIVFGAFVTEGTPYEKVVEAYLLASCQKLGIQPMVIVTPNKGSWLKNVAEKPKAILTILEKMDKDECLVFLDADATIEEYPKLFEGIPEQFEIAYHILDWNIWYGYNSQPPVRELLTGTMFFRNTPTIHDICKEWHTTASTSSIWEQRVLQGILSNSPINKYILPVEYCYMTSLPSGRKPLVQCSPVIKHYQKSRELKREV